MRFFIFFLIILYNNVAFTQTLGWLKVFGGDSFDRGMDICVDKFGDVITTGFTEGVVEFDSGNSSSIITGFGIEDVFTTKHNADGNLLWSGLIGGLYNEFPEGIITDSERNVISVGRFHNVVDFDPGNGQYNITPVDFNDIYISKLDPNGNLIWVKSIGSNTMESPTSVAVDKDNNIYFSGYSNGTLDVNPGEDTNYVTAEFFVVKLTPEGQFVWVKSFIGSGHNIDMVVDDEDNVILIGTLNGTLDFDPGPSSYNLTKIGALDLYVCKLDSAGSFQWAKQIGNSGGFGQPYALDCGPNEELFITGYFNGSLDFDPGVAVNMSLSNGGDDVYLLKLNKNGDFEWVRTFGGNGDDWSQAVKAGPYGEVYITGRFQDTVDMNPGVGIHEFITTGFTDMFITKFNSAGEFESATHIGGANYVSGFGIEVGHSGEVYCTGDFFTTIDFDPTNSFLNVTANGTSDAFILRLNPKDLGIDHDLPLSMLLSPNPTTDVLHFSGIDSGTNQTVQILDLRGKLVDEVILEGNSIDVSQLESGVYLLEVDGSVVRFVKE